MKLKKKPASTKGTGKPAKKKEFFFLLWFKAERESSVKMQMTISETTTMQRAHGVI